MADTVAFVILCYITVPFFIVGVIISCKYVRIKIERIFFGQPPPSPPPPPRPPPHSPPPRQNNVRLIIINKTEHEQEETECSICQETNNINSITCECKNSYHLTCISKWLVENNTCPMCRKEYIITEV